MEGRTCFESHMSGLEIGSVLTQVNILRVIELESCVLVGCGPGGPGELVDFQGC